jgi:hypothetical protein
MIRIQFINLVLTIIKNKIILFIKIKFNGLIQTKTLSFFILKPQHTNFVCVGNKKIFENKL